MTPAPVSADVSQLRIPTWIALLAMAVFLAGWALILSHLIGDHVAAVTGTKAAAVLTTHAAPAVRPA